MSLFRQKGLIWRSSRLSRASLVRTSISGSTRAHISYAFDTTVVTEKFSMRCHNPLNAGILTHPYGHVFSSRASALRAASAEPSAVRPDGLRDMRESHSQTTVIRPAVPVDGERPRG